MTEEKQLELTNKLMEYSFNLMIENKCTPQEGMGIIMSSAVTIAGRVAELMDKDRTTFVKKLLQDIIKQL